MLIIIIVCFFETSAKDHNNIDKAFIQLVETYVDKLEREEKERKEKEREEDDLYLINSNMSIEKRKKKEYKNGDIYDGYRKKI